MAQGFASLSPARNRGAPPAVAPVAEALSGWQAAPAEPAYRPDIDGLRAVAVAGVIAFHYGPGPVGGGFIGVDVFFVISGYLITGILRRSRPDGAFLAGFAERRVRRIVPALLVVIAACCLGATTLLPNDLQAVGLGLMNAVAFNANHVFAAQANDYFAAGALAVDPVLHLWSLAVEAQFYLAVALVWAAGRRWPQARAAALALLGAASLAFSAWGVATRPALAFYLMPSRFWEFMAGGLLAGPGLRAPAGRAATALSAAGLGLVAAGLFAFTARTPFPGAAALVPCLGAALVLGGGATANPVSRALGAPPLALIGRLSYSLYLWHWPVLVFARYGQSDPPSVGAQAGLLALTVLLAASTYRLVERPFIERRRLPRARPFLLACAGAALCVAAGGLAINLAGQNRLTLTHLPPDVTRLADGQYDAVNLRCPVGPSADAGCRFGAPGTEPTIALWGNSFVRMWLPAFDQAARRHGVAALTLSTVRCPPLLDVAFPAIPGCQRFNSDALAFLEAHPALATVVLGGDWTEWPADLSGLRRSVEALRALGRRVVVILSPPTVPYPVPRTLALAALRHEAPPPLVSEAAARAARDAETAYVDALRKDGPLTVVDPFGAFCDGRSCAVSAERRTLYYDDKHVTRFAARRAAPLFDAAVASDLPPP